MQEWAGLGYYARARNLIACARAVAARGGFPTDEAGLRELPGIGAYTAAAVAAIAFSEPVVPVDTNVERVVSRLHGLTDKSEAPAAARAMLPDGRSGDFAQALMDLGAAICRPKNPLCGACPISGDCKAFAARTPELYPAPRTKKVRPQRFGVAWWIERDDQVWLVRRPAKGMLGGMAALPGPEWQDGPLPAPGIVTVRHVFTHFALDLAIVSATEPEGEGWWHPVERLDEAGLPTLYRRAADAVLAMRPALAA
jgi:A/G-specific adenine glycosylase